MEQHYDIEYIQSFNINNIMLRGVKLQNTDIALCAVVYTADDTRLMQNQMPSKPKTSRLEDRINQLILLLTIFTCALIVTFACVGLYVDYDIVSYSLESEGATKVL